MAESIENLRIYGLSRQLEDQVYELVKKLPEAEFYRLGNDLRRSSAAVSHFVSEAHARYSYQVKIESLHCARTQAEATNRLLKRFTTDGYGESSQLVEQYTSLIKQSWGLIKYLKNRQTEKSASDDQISAELVTAQSK